MCYSSNSSPKPCISYTAWIKKYVKVGPYISELSAIKCAECWWIIQTKPYKRSWNNMSFTYIIIVIIIIIVYLFIIYYFIIQCSIVCLFLWCTLSVSGTTGQWLPQNACGSVTTTPSEEKRHVSVDRRLRFEFGRLSLQTQYSQDDSSRANLVAAHRGLWIQASVFLT